MTQLEQILRLQGLFRANSRVIGQHSAELEKSEDGKVTHVRRSFAQGPCTEEHWRNHLEGKINLALVPIDDYSQVKFVCIDVDLDIMAEAKVTLVSLAAQIEAYGFPFVVCRSKSGAAHLYGFLKDLSPASSIRNSLKRYADILGFNNTRPCELYPHTAKLDVSSNGKCITMPYFNGEDTDRYAVDAQGNPLSLNQFIALAESKMVYEKDFSPTKVQESEQGVSIRDIVTNGPPCLQTIYDQGLQDGTKNDILFQFALMFKKYDVNTYEDNTEIVNQTRCDKPHDSSDLTNTLKSLKKKDYHYSCSHPCMASICAKSLCMTRKYGIRPQVEVPSIKEILQWGANDEYFEVIFDTGSKLKILAADFIDFTAMRAAVVQALHIVVPEPKKIAWQEWTSTMMQKVRRMEVPKEFNIEHAIKSLIVGFATGRSLGTKIEELLVNKPVKDGEMIVMRQKDIQAEIYRRNLNKSGYVDNFEMSVINDMGGHMTVKQIEGHIIPVFVIPDPKINHEELLEKVATDFETKY